MRRLAARPIFWAAAGVLLVLGWWWLTVTANYGGNWTALFCTGSRYPLPPGLPHSPVHTFSGTGYDGQFYHLMAHDPWLTRGFDGFADASRLRWRRIGVPAAAWLLAGGSDERIDAAYIAVILLTAGLGIWWLGQYAVRNGRHAVLGLIFLLTPAALVTTDRLVADGMLAALTVAFVLHAERPAAGLWLVLACAVLTRETGLLLVAGFCLAEILQRRWRSAVVFGSAALPGLLWFAYVHSQTSGRAVVPVASPGFRLFRVYASKTLDRYGPDVPFAGLLRGLDYLAITAMLVSIVVVLSLVVRRPRTPVAIAAGLFAVVGLWHQWAHAYDIGRVYTPMFLMAGLYSPGVRVGGGLIVLRVLAQFGRQVAGVFRWATVL